MKRKLNSTVEKNVKRLKLSDVEPIPQEKCNDLDFRSFLLHPQIPFDVTVANKTSEFSCHKRILMNISSVFQALFEGDQSASILRLDDINDENLKLLQTLIYSNPSERKSVFKKAMFTSFKNLKLLQTLIYSNPSERESVFKKHMLTDSNSECGTDTFLNSILLISKYNVGFVDTNFKSFLTKTGFATGEYIALLWNTLREHNLFEHADIISNACANPNPRYKALFDSLKGIPLPILIEMVNRCIERKTFTKILEYSISLSQFHDNSEEMNKVKLALIQRSQNTDINFSSTILEILLE